MNLVILLMKNFSPAGNNRVKLFSNCVLKTECPNQCLVIDLGKVKFILRGNILINKKPPFHKLYDENAQNKNRLIGIGITP